MTRPSPGAQSPRLVPPIDQMPGILPMGQIFGRAEHAIVSLTEIHAYSTGCVFYFVGAAIRPDLNAPPPWGDPDQGIRIFARVSGHDDERLRFSVEYPDGTTVSSLDPATESTVSDGVVFTCVEGRGSADKDGSRLIHSQPVWLSPLPSAGKISLIAHWPAYGITHAALHCDCATLGQTADDTRFFWQT